MIAQLFAIRAPTAAVLPTIEQARAGTFPDQQLIPFVSSPLRRTQVNAYTLGLAQNAMLGAEAKLEMITASGA